MDSTSSYHLFSLHFTSSQFLPTSIFDSSTDRVCHHSSSLRHKKSYNHVTPLTAMTSSLTTSPHTTTFKEVHMPLILLPLTNNSLSTLDILHWRMSTMEIYDANFHPFLRHSPTRPALSHLRIIHMRLPHYPWIPHQTTPLTYASSYNTTTTMMIWKNNKMNIFRNQILRFKLTPIKSTSPSQFFCLPPYPDPFLSYFQVPVQRSLMLKRKKEWQG